VKSKEEIDELIEDVKELGSRIQSIDNLIQAIEDSEIKEKYHKDLLALIGNYNRLLNLLEQEIVEYGRHERANNLPINLRYRSILKTLRTR
jgi:cell division septum initiation protein DivIVA